MQIILGRRGSGKTTKLIKLSAETQSYIVCRSQDEAARISSIATEMKLNIPFPLTYSEFIQKQFYARGIKGFLIDNAEALLQSMAGSVPVNGITMTCDNSRKKWWKIWNYKNKLTITKSKL